MFIQIRKDKVTLSDYSYQRDIKNRLLLSEMSANEIFIMNEIVNNSLRIPIYKLEASIGISGNELEIILNKLIENHFIKIDDHEIFVDKDQRRYYEGQMIKFEPGFVPGIDYLHSLLHQVPIHILPDWYSIPRTTDNIFEAIVDKLLSTPKVYERYLEDVVFDIPVLKLIYKEVLSAPDFSVSAKELMHKFELSHREFEEYVLMLEFHFICCLTYQKQGDRWEEVVTPFYEWREYLRFKRDTFPKSLSGSACIEIIKGAQDSRQDFVHTLSLVEKSLCRIVEEGWVYLEDFMKGFVSSPFGRDMVVLKHKGKKWHYELPQYTDGELKFYAQILCEDLFEAGIIAVGWHCGKKCIRLTPFGQRVLSE